MFVLKSKGSFHDIYQLIGKYLDDGFMVVYGVASGGPNASKGKFVKHIVQEVQASAKIRNVKQMIGKGALRIVDIRRIYAEKNVENPSELLEEWTRLFIQTQQSSSFRGLAVIASGIGASTHPGAEAKLVSYEQTILRGVTELGYAQVVCCYPPDSLNKLSFSSLVAIAAAHQCIMSDRMEYREISKSVLLEAIDSGIENVLGAESAKLILRTMKMIYRLDEDAILSTPKVFEEKLCKLLGRASAPVLTSVSHEVRELLRARAGDAASVSYSVV